MSWYMCLTRCLAIDVVNGEKNNVFLAVENKSDRNITLQSIAGSIHHPETNALVKNVRLVLLTER